jgi:hypothetical protein
MALERDFQVSETERFVADFLHTFLRMLDPNLPAPRASKATAVDEPRWSTGQTVAFAIMMLSVGFFLLAGVVYGFA